MTVAALEPNPLDLAEPAVAVRWADAQQQDAYWEQAFRRERYCRTGLDYEDYAPAYCVGYAGHAQYGGSFEEAERSLCANWVRIKGDSRLALDDAMLAIRAAWDRMARGDRDEPSRVFDIAAFRQARQAPTYRPGIAAAR